MVDIIEGTADGAEIIDYKKGSARRDSEGDRVAKEPDAMQVAAHAMLLKEHGINAVRGAIYYAADKRRVPVEFNEELFCKVRKAIEEARAVAASGHCPPPLKNDARCLYCSAYPICLPNESLWWAKRRSQRKMIRRFSLVLLGNQKTQFAAKFSKRWILPPKPLTKNRHYNHRALAATMVKFLSCKLPAHKSASAVMN